MPADPAVPRALHRVVIVGGGAGGLALAARLGDTLGRRGEAEIVLVDQTMAYTWKPLLHELAAGTLLDTETEVDFLHQARRHHFRFHLGRMEGLDRARREVRLAALADDTGAEVAPPRTIAYDTLVIAVGSKVFDFGVPGVADHAMTLDDAEDARRFHRRLLAACTRAETRGDESVDIVIVGGGATGVELAAELADAGAEIASFGTRLREQPQPIRLHLVETGPRLVPTLPTDLSAQVRDALAARGVDVRLGEPVTGVTADEVTLASGATCASSLTVWAAGVHGAPVLRQLDGLELNRQGQLVVRPTLQTTRDDAVFAIGDCASCAPVPAQPPLPARAQVADQQARFMVRAMRCRVAGAPLPSFTFHDRGSLLSLGRSDAVGSVTPAPTRFGGLRLAMSGAMARLGYWVAQREHLIALHGAYRTALMTLATWLAGRSRARVKLH